MDACFCNGNICIMDITSSKCFDVCRIIMTFMQLKWKYEANDNFKYCTNFSTLLEDLYFDTIEIKDYMNK